MDWIRNLGIVIVGGLVMFILVRELLSALVTGTTASESLLTSILPLVVAGSIIVVVLAAFLAFKSLRGGE